MALKKKKAPHTGAGQRKRKSGLDTGVDTGGGEELALHTGGNEADGEGAEPALPVAKRASSGSARFYKDEDGNVKPVRQVPREYEGDYIVKLPSKSKGAAAKSPSGGIFNRIGGGIGGGNKKGGHKKKVSKGGANKAKARPTIKSPGGGGIFSRLGSGDVAAGPGNGGKRGKGRAVTIAPQRQSIHDRLGK